MRKDRVHEKSVSCRERARRCRFGARRDGDRQLEDTRDVRWTQPEDHVGRRPDLPKGESGDELIARQAHSASSLRTKVVVRLSSRWLSSRS